MCRAVSLIARCSSPRSAGRVASPHIIGKGKLVACRGIFLCFYKASHLACSKVIQLLCLLRLLPVLSPILEPCRDQDSLKVSAILSHKRASSQASHCSRYGSCSIIKSSRSSTRIKSGQYRRVKEKLRLYWNYSLRRTVSSQDRIWARSGRTQVAAGHQRRRVRSRGLRINSVLRHTAGHARRPGSLEQGEFKGGYQTGKPEQTGEQHLSLQEEPRLSSTGWIARA